MDEIDDTIVQFNWYFFPKEIQCALPTVMLSTQQPVVITCFGNVSCGREQYKKVSFVLRFIKLMFYPFEKIEILY